MGCLGPITNDGRGLRLFLFTGPTIGESMAFTQEWLWARVGTVIKASHSVSWKSPIKLRYAFILIELLVVIAIIAI